MGARVKDFKQGHPCIDEPLQPLHALCYRAVVIYVYFKLFNFSTSTFSIQ